MKYRVTTSLVVSLIALSACQQSNTSMPVKAAADACGAAQFQSLVGGPSSATRGLDIPDSSRHYGSKEAKATNDPNRLNFVHSGTAIEAVIDPKSTVIRVFCG